MQMCDTLEGMATQLYPTLRKLACFIRAISAPRARGVRDVQDEQMERLEPLYVGGQSTGTANGDEWIVKRQSDALVARDIEGRARIPPFPSSTRPPLCTYTNVRKKRIKPEKPTGPDFAMQNKTKCSVPSDHISFLSYALKSF